MDRTGDPATFEADVMHTLLVLRADAIEGCTENSEEARELAMIAETIEAYKQKRRPDGKVSANLSRTSCWRSSNRAVEFNEILTKRGL
jgi:hypothetical protein